MSNAKVEIERFDISKEYENNFLQLIKQEHIKRYQLAAAFIKDNCSSPKILDAACGNGYGFEYLEGSYLGIDISKDTIEANCSSYPNAKFIVGDLDSPTTIQVPTDVIVSFETIEHLKDPDGFCCNCYAQLKKSDGYFIFSAPTVLTRDFDRYHLHDRSEKQWRETATNAGFTILREASLGFQIDFKTFATSTPGNPDQSKYLINFLLRHPKYLLARIWEWGVKGRFTWGNQIFFCKA